MEVFLLLFLQFLQCYVYKSNEHTTICLIVITLDSGYITKAKAKGILFITLPAEEAHRLRKISVKTWDVFAK